MTNCAKCSFDALAYTFGKISPKSNNTPVMAKISTTNVSRGLQLSGEKKLFNKYVDTMTIPTLTKLLEMRMVANRWSGSSRSSNIFCWRGSLSSISSRSAGVMEKKATSDPEISADKSSNKARTKSSKISADARCPRLWAISKNNEGGSVSKGMVLVRLRTVGHLHPVTGMNWQ